jgi:hypothetical protein
MRMRVIVKRMRVTTLPGTRVLDSVKQRQSKVTSSMHAACSIGKDSM